MTIYLICTSDNVTNMEKSASIYHYHGNKPWESHHVKELHAIHGYSFIGHQTQYHHCYLSEMLFLTISTNLTFVIYFSYCCRISHSCFLQNFIYYIPNINIMSLIVKKKEIIIIINKCCEYLTWTYLASICASPCIAHCSPWCS